MDTTPAVLSFILFLLVGISNAMSFSIFLRCRLMFTQIRVILISQTLQAMVCSTVAIFAYIFMLERHYSEDIPCAIIHVILTIGVMTPFALSAYLTVDRYMSQTWPFWHTRVITTKVTITVCVVIAAAILGLGCLFLANIHPSQDRTECEEIQHMSKSGIAVEIIILTLCIAFSTASWIGIAYHTKKYTRSVLPTTNSRENISRLVDTFQMSIFIFIVDFVKFLFILPIYVVNIMRLSDMTNTNLMVIYNRAYIAFFVIIVLNPLVFIYKFRECHFHALKQFCFCSKRLQEKAEMLQSVFRLEHARIPTPALGNVSRNHSPIASPMMRQRQNPPQKNVLTLQVPGKKCRQTREAKRKFRSPANTIRLVVETRHNIPTVIHYL